MSTFHNTKMTFVGTILTGNGSKAALKSEGSELNVFWNKQKREDS